MTTLYFVRHGETDYNRNRIIQGRKIDSALNATGRAQAACLARRLAGLGVDAIYTSTLRRARETAAIVAAEHPGVPVRLLPELEEMSWGIYEGESSSEAVLRMFDGMYARWQAGDFGHPVEGGESILDVQARAVTATRHILDRHRSGTVVVVAHGRLLRVLLSTLLDEYGLERMHEIQHANTAVNRLVWDGTGFRADLLNCTAHLDEADVFMVE